MAPGGSGETSSKGIEAAQLDVVLTAPAEFWQGVSVGEEKEAVVTFTDVNPTGKETSALKPQSNGLWGEGIVEVVYDVPEGRIQVWTYEPEKGWVQHGEDIPVDFADGDVFGARVKEDGTLVEIYRNGKLLTKQELALHDIPILARAASPKSEVFGAGQGGVLSLSKHGAQLVSFEMASLPASALPNLPLPNPVLSGVEGLPLQQGTPLTIDYTYDALNRLTSAAYSDGRSFGYTYDPAGNVLELEQDLGPGTVTTTYTYNIANELVTAQKDGTTWQYEYDANGSLTEVLPNGNPGNGAKRYTYNAAGNLIQVEAQNGTAWNTQAEMDYNGLGQRLSMDAAGVIAYYVMGTSTSLSASSDRPLTAESNGNTTFYLYGLGAIAEKTNSWAYSLPDGTNTPRQLTNLNGEVTLAGRYTPWGDVLEVQGAGNFTFGYLGGILDAATNLIYVGNGQYYDPSTGRFLTRDVYPNSPNPYVPWNPIGAIVGPLGLISLAASRRRGKRNKHEPYLFLFIMLVVLPLSIGIACREGSLPPGPVTATIVSTPGAPATYTATFANGVTVTGTLPASGGAPTQVLGVPCQTPETPTPIGTPTPTPLDPVLESYGVRFIGNMAGWTSSRVAAVREAVTKVASRMAEVAGGGRSSEEVFRLVYEGLSLSWGFMNASGECLTIGDGGCTSGPHDINFVNLSDEPLRARNNVVHEMGHAFSKNWPETSLTPAQLEYFRWHPEETNPAIVLAWAQSYSGLPEHYIPNFPDRQNPTDGRLGGFYGFASQQNQLTWQIAVTNAGDPGEEFADQFLGWTFDNTWEVVPGTGLLSNDATLRRNFMDRYMPGWISYRINH